AYRRGPWGRREPRGRGVAFRRRIGQSPPQSLGAIARERTRGKLGSGRGARIPQVTLMSSQHARSDEFLELVRRARQGRLKVFLGPTAGVGKTYRMLQEAHQLEERGVDVVIGVIDTHGREETMALMEGLEQVPMRVVEYRGVS